MGAYKNPFKGQLAPGSNKPSRPKQFLKKQSNSADEDRRSPKKKSPWALLGAVGSFAALWVFTIFKVQGDSQQKRLSDKRILNTLMFKPVHYTDHAICRMKCRCASKLLLVKMLTLHCLTLSVL